MASIILKPGREKSLLRRHPWIFSGAIAKINGSPHLGACVDILSSEGRPFGKGAYSPKSQITVRVWTFSPEENISPEFFKDRIKTAINQRNTLLSNPEITACRLVNAESDDLPGLIIDRYGDFIVIQLLTAGAEYWKREIILAINELFPNRGIYERSDVNIRDKEGLPPSTGLLSGQEPPEYIEVREQRCKFLVDVKHGQKTGIYIDQRNNRICAEEYAKDAEVLNCFSYTGGFGITALKAGARHVTNIDTSSWALKLTEKNASINQLDKSKYENIEGDVFKILRQYREGSRTFDMIILDPPKFAESKAHIKQAGRGYKDINMYSFHLIRPGGVLFTFSCSGIIDVNLFQKIVSDAAIDAGRKAHIIKRLYQGEDHPTSLNFPEGTYLKGLVCRVL